MLKRSPEEKKQAALEMQARIDAIPAASHGPLMRYDEALVSSFMSVISGLKSFIRFLSNLSKKPKEYVQWFYDACSRFNRSEAINIVSDSSVSSSGELPDFNTTLPETLQQKTNAKSKRIKFFSRA